MITIIATFDVDGEVLSWTALPHTDPDAMTFSQGDEDAIRTYVTETPSLDPPDVEDALDLMGQMHALDAMRRVQ